MIVLLYCVMYPGSGFVAATSVIQTVTLVHNTTISDKAIRTLMFLIIRLHKTVL